MEDFLETAPVWPFVLAILILGACVARRTLSERMVVLGCSIAVVIGGSVFLVTFLALFLGPFVESSLTFSQVWAGVLVVLSLVALVYAWMDRDGHPKRPVRKGIAVPRPRNRTPEEATWKANPCVRKFGPAGWE